MAETEYLNKVYHGRDIAKVIVRNLKYYSQLFYQVGNEKLGDEFLEDSITLENAIEELCDGFDMLFDQSVRSAQEATFNMLSAALAVTTKGLSGDG